MIKLFDFFDSIIDSITKVFDFLLSLVTDLIQFIQLATESVKIPYYFADYMPGILGTAMVGVTALAIVKVLVGR